MLNNKEAELKYHERLNISVLSIGRIKEILKNDIKDTIYAWNKGHNIQKQTYRIIGPAGVGKTQICQQIADELTNELFTDYNDNHDDQKQFEMIMVKAPVLSRDDFIIPFPVANKKGGDFSFKMLYSDFVPKEKKSFGIFVIDECSRGDHQLQQLLWQIQDEQSVHRFKFPKGWFIISIDNPDDSEYSMDILEDAAGLRRQLHLYVEVSTIDFLHHAIKNKFHPWIIEFIQTHPEYIYDFQSQKIGSVYANPASYEKLSNHLWKMQIRRDDIDFEEIEVKASGLLNTHMTQLFIEFARDKKDINPKDIYASYNKIKYKINDLLLENNMSKLSELMIGFCTYMSTSMPKYKKLELNNILNFLLSMPIDIAALFITQIDNFKRNSSQFKYMTKIHLDLLKISDRYKEEFYNPIVQVAKS